MLSQILLPIVLGLVIIPLASTAPAPVPNGGVGVRTNDTPPIYAPMSDFDFESLNLALYQEWIELDLFNYAVARFSSDDFAAAGLGADDISLIQFMANQEVGHATLISNLQLNGGRPAAKQCEYRYYFQNVREFVDFTQKLTRWGESGVYGFLSHLDSRPAATTLLQSITTEARQQMVFRQFSGAHPMPVYFETGISQSMAWSLLSRYIIGCPDGTPRIGWQLFPALNVTNGSPLTVDGYNAAITHNRTSLTQPGDDVSLSWETPGLNVSANNSYVTSVANATALPAYVAWISQLNVTYTALEVTSNTTGRTTQPNGTVFDSVDYGIVNGTMFLALTDTDLHVTPYNLSLLNDHILAWGIYQAD